MDSAMTYEQAKARVARLKGFYVHLIVYVGVNTLLFAINAVNGGPWWFQYPLLGWGIGIAAHAIGVFGGPMLLGPAWEQKKIDELMKRDRR